MKPPSNPLYFHPFIPGHYRSILFALERKESRGLHYTIDYPVHAYDK